VNKFVHSHGSITPLMSFKVLRKGGIPAREVIRIQ